MQANKKLAILTTATYSHRNSQTLRHVAWTALSSHSECLAHSKKAFDSRNSQDGPHSSRFRGNGCTFGRKHRPSFQFMPGLRKGRGGILHGHCLYTWDRIKMDGAQKEINLDVVKESETCQYQKQQLLTWFHLGPGTSCSLLKGSYSLGQRVERACMLTVMRAFGERCNAFCDILFAVSGEKTPRRL